MQARRSLEKVRIKLLRPTVEALDSSAGDLMTAVDSLRRLEMDLASDGWRGAGSERPLELQISAMRDELRNVRGLLESAGKFHEGWARLASTVIEDTAPGYTAGGKSRQPIPINSARLVVHG
ncbi:MAG TPA: hypothetical protein VIX89_19235 [Bryobacteraceae bacterium]